MKTEVEILRTMAVKFRNRVLKTLDTEQSLIAANICEQMASARETLPAVYVSEPLNWRGMGVL